MAVPLISHESERHERQQSRAEERHQPRRVPLPPPEAHCQTLPRGIPRHTPHGAADQQTHDFRLGVGRRQGGATVLGCPPCVWREVWREVEGEQMGVCSTTEPWSHGGGVGRRKNEIGAKEIHRLNSLFRSFISLFACLLVCSQQCPFLGSLREGRVGR